MPSKRSPLVLYESLPAAPEGGEERERVRALRRLLRRPEARGRALAPLAAVAGRGGALLPRGVAARVERLARAERRSLDDTLGGGAVAPCQFGGVRRVAKVGVGVVAVHAFVAETLEHVRGATWSPAFALRWSWRGRGV